jgi:hypothetical protein
MPSDLSPAALAQAPVPWAMPGASTGHANLLFVRVIARRNFSGFPFWVSCPPDSCERVAEVFRAEARARGLGPGLTLASLPRETIGVLRERMALPERPSVFPGKRDFKQWVPGAEPGEHVLLGETEQWTHVRLAAGGPTDAAGSADAFARAAVLARASARDADNARFARRPAWGFLASNPAFAGSGLQVEAGVHLPALAGTRLVPQVRQALAAMGCELQPLSLREPGSAEAGYFRLLSRGGLDLTGEELVLRFAGQVESTLRAEADAWDRWRAREADVLEDRMHRALRVLQEARRMVGPELLLLTSWARAGVYAGVFPGVLTSSLETLRVQAQPFHLAAAAPDAPQAGNPDGAEAAWRAGLARRLLNNA